MLFSSKLKKNEYVSKISTEIEIPRNFMWFVSIMIYFTGDTLVYFMTVKCRTNMILKIIWKSWKSPEYQFSFFKGHDAKY